jgi:hypothetical protein
MLTERRQYHYSVPGGGTSGSGRHRIDEAVELS